MNLSSLGTRLRQEDLVRAPSGGELGTFAHGGLSAGVGVVPSMLPNYAPLILMLGVIKVEISNYDNLICFILLVKEPEYGAKLLPSSLSLVSPSRLQMHGCHCLSLEFTDQKSSFHL